MKVLLVNGSPHPQGCTFTALSEVASELEKQGIETNIFQLGTQPIAGCIACGSCRKTGKCFRDDKVNEALALVPESSPAEDILPISLVPPSLAVAVAEPVRLSMN